MLTVCVHGARIMEIERLEMLKEFHEQDTFEMKYTNFKV
jgi:hypothetical protein